MKIHAEVASAHMNYVIARIEDVAAHTEVTTVCTEVEIAYIAPMKIYAEVVEAQTNAVTAHIEDMISHM